jgi:hypothetical protein
MLTIVSVCSLFGVWCSIIYDVWGNPLFPACCLALWPIIPIRPPVLDVGCVNCASTFKCLTNLMYLGLVSISKRGNCIYTDETWIFAYFLKIQVFNAYCKMLIQLSLAIYVIAPFYNCSQRCFGTLFLKPVSVLSNFMYETHYVRQRY